MAEEFELVSVKEYHRIKRTLQKKEKVNYDSVIVIPCNGNKGWMEFADHSALFFYYNVVEKLSLNYKFMNDAMSLYDQYEIGYMRTQSVERIEEKLAQVGLYKSTEKDGAFTIIKLNKTFSKREVDELIKKERQRRMDNLTVKEAVNLDPELHYQLASIGARLHGICRGNMKNSDVQTMGVRMLDLIDESLILYFQTTMMKGESKTKIVDKLIQIRKNIYDMMVVLRAISSVGIWKNEVCVSIAEPLEVAKRFIERDIRRIKMAERKKKDGEEKKSEEAEDEAI